MFSPIFPCPLDSLWAKIQDGRHFRGDLVVHTHFVEICMCDTCSIPFPGTGNSFPCTKSSFGIIWDHNWAFKHHLIAISRSFKVHPYMLDIRMIRTALNNFIWLLTYLRVSEYDINAIWNCSWQYNDHGNAVSRSYQGHSFISSMHGIWSVAYMCDTCSIPFSGTGNSFPCFKSW